MNWLSKNFQISIQKDKSLKVSEIFGRNTAVGSQVLVFMLRRLFTNWKQQLAFFIIKSSIKKDELSIILD